MNGFINIIHVSWKKILLFVLFGIVCISIIYFVIRIISSKEFAAGVTVSNVAARGATIAFVTRNPEKDCAGAYRFIPPSVHWACDDAPTKLHVIILGGLSPGSTYRLLVKTGGAWRGHALSASVPRPAAPTAADVATIALPVVKSLSKDIQIDLNTAVVVAGAVTDSAGIAEPDALVVVSKGGSSPWSTRTNAEGKFSIVAPGLTALDIASIRIWSSHGFVAASQPVIQVLKETPLFETVAYE